MLRLGCLLAFLTIPLSCASHVDLYGVAKAVSDSNTSADISVEEFTVLLGNNQLGGCGVEVQMKHGDKLETVRIRHRDLTIIPCIMAVHGGRGPVSLQMSFYNTGREIFVVPLDEVKIGSGKSGDPIYSPYVASVEKHVRIEDTVSALDRALESQSPFPESEEGWEKYSAIDNRVTVGPNEQFSLCFTFQPPGTGKSKIHLQLEVVHAESRESIRYSFEMMHAMRRTEMVY